MEKIRLRNGIMVGYEEMVLVAANINNLYATGLNGLFALAELLAVCRGEILEKRKYTEILKKYSFIQENGEIDFVTQNIVLSSFEENVRPLYAKIIHCCEEK